MSRTLDDLAYGESAVIARLAGLDGATEKRLLDLGLIIGETVTLIQRAPLGDPVWLEVKGYQLALRREVARCILVKRKETGPA